MLRPNKNEMWTDSLWKKIEHMQRCLSLLIIK